MKKKKESGLLVFVKVLWFIIKIPYYIVKGIYLLIKKIVKKSKEVKVERRQNIMPKYEDFKVIDSKTGDYKTWVEDTFSSDSKIGIILGSRGSGKTAFGIKFLENYHAKYRKKCYAIGFHKEELPNWITVIQDINKIENDSFVLIDEGGVLFNSRDFMTKPNKILSDLMLIARHKNISILFISQNSSNLEINILRQADFLVLKPGSLLQNEFERKIIQKIYEKVEKEFEKFKDVKGITYIYASKFRGFISNPLPSFWKESISKSFKKFENK
jgi:hypothetical protein